MSQVSIGTKTLTWRWLGPLGIASVILAASGGCCGGRLVSVQLYEQDPLLSAACGGGGEGHRLLVAKGRPGLHLPGHFAPTGHQAFAAPAVTPPIPRFHAVPTRPVFEPRGEHAPLRLLTPDSLQSPSGIDPEPTPAKLPATDKPPS